MDQELRQYLADLEERLFEKSRLMETRSEANFANLAHLITDVKESLERDLEGIKIRFDTQAARLDRQAALIQTGSRWSSRIDTWTEKVDLALDKKDAQIEALNERLKKLEGRP